MPKVSFSSHISQVSQNLFSSSNFTALYLLYAKLEEEHGSAKHIMSVYERATEAVLPEEKFEVPSFLQTYCLYY